MAKSPPNPKLLFRSKPVTMPPIAAPPEDLDLSEDSVVSRGEYWRRVKFLSFVFERQLEAITVIERMNILQNLSNNFDVDIEDLYKVVEFGEESGEARVNLFHRE